jgi:hypothetical protein
MIAQYFFSFFFLSYKEKFLVFNIEAKKMHVFFLYLQKIFLNTERERYTYKVSKFKAQVHQR